MNGGYGEMTMDYPTALALIEDLKNRNVDKHARLQPNEDPEEFGSAYSVHLRTPTPELSPDALGAISECKCALTYLGEMDGGDGFRHEWLVEPKRE